MQAKGLGKGKPRGRPFTSDDPRRKPFTPGVSSGNPKGRAVGSRPAVLAALDAIGNENANKIVRKCIAKAIEGDPHAMELILRRVWPPCRGGRPVVVDLPPLDTVIARVAGGHISPEDGEVFSNMLEGLRRLFEAGDHETRIALLEAALAEKGKPK
jgi:hypothetical protein